MIKLDITSAKIAELKVAHHIESCGKIKGANAKNFVKSLR
ncbi:hypothetical protein HAPS_1359 [Glaesserella parasuis SH0165]|uniref:Uncharacterized protein n=1 Tax=Glaesserella parasuis serovar 5 (strain SH0165) TaxID=557723 RepID=B8F6I7_GLAP5|nr:hypothetical protein HAPS_1359 [Glaesserella parasuis SH0165]EQA01445.1 hypothetical protein HPSNAG_1333 [Glaesserella parasuis str. Nagasaki]